MATLLLISQEQDGSLTTFTNVFEPLTPSQLMQVFPALQKLYPGLRHGPIPYDGPNPELVKELIAWRRARSQELGVSAYIVLSQRLYGMDILRITCQ